MELPVGAKESEMTTWIGGYDRTDDSNAIKPVAEYQDPVNKMRVSQPQSLIDTDFEYGLQPTKWDAVTLSNNRPTLFYDATAPLAVTAIARTAARTITVNTTTPPAVGAFVYVQDSLNPIANGWWMVETVVAATSFTYTIPVDIAAGALLDANKTYVFQAFPYTGAAIFVDPAAGAAFTNSGTTVTCATTARIQGVHVGMTIAVNGTTATTNPPNGNWVISRVTANNSFEFVVINAPTGAITASAGSNNTLFVRPNSFSIHRPFDGGVQLSAGAGAIGNQLIRQTRRYFRYQSGKGIQFSTGTALAPALYPDNIARSNTSPRLFNFFFRLPHEMQPGSQVLVENWVPESLNGIWNITATASDLTFQATKADGTTPEVPVAVSFPPSTITPMGRILPYRWHGSQNRVGMFDLQNGVFFEFDGQEVSIVRRSSVNQLSGTVSASANDSLITGTSTNFSTQLRVNDNIVIRGMTYRVESVISDTQIHVSPLWRGATQSNMIATRTTDLRVPQSQWNIDKMDGTGPSGYKLDITRMQMVYIDYSWYGAGFIRWGVRATDGTVRFCHKIINNNVNTEAYMRSGNLPAHYESSTMPVTALLTATLANTNTVSINVDDASRFPASGTVRVRATATNGAVEYISYASKTSNTLVGLTRGLAQGAAATTFTLAAGSQIPVELVTPTSAAAVSHWGSSVIMDGRYDDDQSFVFNTGNAAVVNIPAGNSRALLSIRLAPTVDSGLTGVIGAREIINRMQLRLRSIGFLSSGNTTLRLNLVLNGRASAGTFAAVGGSSLAQVAIHTTASATTVTGGESIAGYFLNVSGGANFTTTTAELNLVRDLGNAIVGGGTNLTVPTTVNNMYPDGPDIVHVVITNLGSNAADVICRLSWTEAQA
jgi:hypothetical protein